MFTIHELKALCGQSVTTFITDGEQVLTWRDSLGDKYSDLPGVRKLHDFLVVKAHNGDVVMKVRENCFTGVCGRIRHFESETALQSGFQRPTTVTPTFTAFQPRKWPTWSPCMTVSFLWIVVQITCQPARQHQLSLLLQHLHLQQHLEDRGKESKASAQQRAVTDQDTKIPVDGLTVTGCRRGQ